MPQNPTIYEQVRMDYNTQATKYNDLFKSPFGILETQLVAAAVSDDGFCEGASVLDIGGGTGMRARQVLALGAAKVDVVDISTEMVEVGKKDADNMLDQESAVKLRWFLGDASSPLFGAQGIKGLQDPGTYDLVMANWMFDHVGDLATLEAIWRNIAAAVRPGGRFVGVRASDPRAPAMIDGLYGPICHSFEEFPGGLNYRSIIPAEPPVHIKNCSLEISFSGSTELHEKHGFSDVETVKPELMEIVGADPEFWKVWVEQPGFEVVRARRT
ncbi:methyltransferase-like protein [Stachybotrys elegans]|uniref:Methyltransferase-like protein n=1 Tax=Stachybotrys elegans TaxID=80388 RepID=A0A8K0SC01_9HYPO|nr:methyltransferase-like protein [Stachybotrys elegans]